MEKKLFCQDLGFVPFIEDNHVLYYEKDGMKIFNEKYKMEKGNMIPFMEITKGDKVIYTGELKSEEEINSFLKK